jgi:hypothetical protein
MQSSCILIEWVSLEAALDQVLGAQGKIPVLGALLDSRWIGFTTEAQRPRRASGARRVPGTGASNKYFVVFLCAFESFVSCQSRLSASDPSVSSVPPW